MILVVDMNWKKDSLGSYEFVLPIVAAVKPLSGWTVRHYLEVTGKDLKECDVVVLSGTPLKDTATLSQPEKFQWLKDTDTPVLGICAGMETAGAVFGAPLRRYLEIGMTPIQVVKENPLVSGDFKAYSLHSVCVEESADFEVWAKSAHCIQIVKHKRKEIYGTLFHPEVRNQEILTKFIQLYREQK
jgi:GMP synthase (glutamine-hydrolysing)